MSDEQIIELRTQRQELKQRIKDAEKEIAEINKKLLSIMKLDKIEEHTYDGLTTQVIQATQQEYDWDGIKSKVGALRWRTIVREVPDVELLNMQIAGGKIKPSDISPFVTTENRGEPYIKVDKAKKEEVE